MPSGSRALVRTAAADRERQIHLGLHASHRQHSAVSRRVPEVLQKSGFADTSFADEHQNLAAARPQGGEQLLQPLPLGIAVRQRRGPVGGCRQLTTPGPNTGKLCHACARTAELRVIPGCLQTRSRVEPCAKKCSKPAAPSIWRRELSRTGVEWSRRRCSAFAARPFTAVQRNGEAARMQDGPPCHAVRRRPRSCRGLRRANSR